MSNISQRINELAIELFNGNNSEFAKELGTSEANIRNYRKNVPPKVEFLNLINEKFEINFEWLIKGTGLKRSSIDSVSYVNQPPQSIIQIGNRLGERLYEQQRVPLYNIEAAAGMVSLYNDKSSTIPVGDIMVPELPYCDGAIYVAGDSMYPLLKSRDIVMFAKIPAMKEHQFLYGEIYIITFNNGDIYNTVVKWVKKSDAVGFITLVSANQHHSDVDIPIKDIKALAVVKGSIRINMS
jgi:phage repressor protein C with HTH and peptisase S24 domain